MTCVDTTQLYRDRRRMRENAATCGDQGQHEQHILFEKTRHQNKTAQSIDGFTLRQALAVAGSAAVTPTLASRERSPASAPAAAQMAVNVPDGSGVATRVLVIVTNTLRIPPLGVVARNANWNRRASLLGCGFHRREFPRRELLLGCGSNTAASGDGRESLKLKPQARVLPQE